MTRFVLLTCWLIGAGGGWGLALAGLNAMGSGSASFAELIMLGGASSWAAMLVTALRPGQRPNTWQRVFTGMAWLMPVGMFLLGDTFNLNVRLFSVVAAACVTMIVVIYPSQSAPPRVDDGRRLALHLRELEMKQKRQMETSGEAPVQAAEAPMAEISPAGLSGTLGGRTVSGAGDGVAGTLGDRAQAAAPEPDRTGWAPEAKSRATEPGHPESVEEDSAQEQSGEESGSRWQTPQVRRRGKLRDDRNAASGLPSPQRRDR